MDFTGIGLQRACDDPDQRGFSGAVFPHQRVDFTGPQLKGNAAERLDTAKRFADFDCIEKVLHVAGESNDVTANRVPGLFFDGRHNAGGGAGSGCRSDCFAQRQGERGQFVGFVFVT